MRSAHVYLFPLFLIILETWHNVTTLKSFISSITNEVMHELGQSIHLDRISAEEQEHQVNLEFLPNSTYIIHLAGLDLTSSQQFVIQR
ncbi:MAG: hypothetical protein JKY52_16695 [Flavobacteriales bacterium]|nr:hypothetical protein [Flavobacteriales bacterium]